MILMNMQWNVLFIMVHNLVCGDLKFQQRCWRNAEHVRIATWQLNHKWIWWKKCFLFLPRVYLPPSIIAALSGFKQFIVFFTHHNSSSNTLIDLGQNDGFYWNNQPHIYICTYRPVCCRPTCVTPVRCWLNKTKIKVCLIKCFKGKIKRVELSTQVISISSRRA